MQVLILLKLQILQLKDVEFAIKSKPIELLTEFKYFKFVTTLVSVLIKIERKWR